MFEWNWREKYNFKTPSCDSGFLVMKSGRIRFWSQPNLVSHGHFVADQLRFENASKQASSRFQTLLIIHHMIIELGVVVLVFGLADGDGILRVTVQHTGNHLRDDVAPFVLGL